MSENPKIPEQVHASDAGIGHNQGPEKEPVVWERWTKKRVFVRALEGTYGNLIKDLFTQPRVISTSAYKWKGGPQNYHKSIISPQEVRIAQSIETHVDCLAPGGFGQRHGHMNSAVFFVLKGKGYDIHDRRKLPWEAGDALIVENACVHQHLNSSEDEEAVVVVMKAKPLFLFMHMLFQKVAEFPPDEPAPNQVDYKPCPDL